MCCSSCLHRSLMKATESSQVQILVLLALQLEQSVTLPSFYSEDTPASANETWARLHSDPLFAVSLPTFLSPTTPSAYWKAASSCIALSLCLQSSPLRVQVPCSIPSELSLAATEPSVSKFADPARGDWRPQADRTESCSDGVNQGGGGLQRCCRANAAAVHVLMVPHALLQYMPARARCCCPLWLCLR